MGTKVQYTSYLPGYYSMRNINEETNVSWPQYFKGRTSNGQFCNGISAQPLEGNLDYDKEEIKQTMLRHEEIFRKQILELHQLYRKQKDLMEEFRKKEEKKNSISPTSNLIVVKDKEKSWLTDGYPFIHDTYSRAPTSGANDSNSSLNTLKGCSFLKGLMLKENEAFQDNKLQDSRVREYPRKMLDLELPAEAYIDEEDENDVEHENAVKPLLGSLNHGKKSFCKSENSVKLPLGAQNPFRSGESHKSGSDQKVQMQMHQLADLNEPLNSESSEETITTFTKFPVQMTHIQYLKGHQKSVKPGSSFRVSLEDPSHSRYNDGDGALSMHVDRREKGKKHSFCSDEFGQSRLLSSHTNSFTSTLVNNFGRSLPETFPICLSQAHGLSSIFPPRQYENDTRIREKQYQGTEYSDRGHHIPNKALPKLVVPLMAGSVSASVIYYTSTSSSVISPWKEPANSISSISTAIQESTCFDNDASIPTNSQTTSLSHIEIGRKKVQWGHVLSSMQKLGRDMHSYPNGSNQCLADPSMCTPSISFSDHKPNLTTAANVPVPIDRGHKTLMNGFCCTEIKAVEGLNLNLEPTNGFQDASTSKAKRLAEIEGNKESQLGGIPWLRSKSPFSKACRADTGAMQKEVSNVDGHMQSMTSYLSSEKEIEWKREAVSSCLVLKPKETAMEQDDAVNSSSSNRIHGSPLPQMTQQSKCSFTTVLHAKMPFNADDGNNRSTKGYSPADSSVHLNLHDMEKHTLAGVLSEKSTAEAVNCFRFPINLNSSATCMDQLRTSESSPEDEGKLPSPPSVQGIATRFSIEIDLEASPPSSEEEETPLMVSASHLDQLVQSVTPECRRVDLHTTGAVDEVLARIAAEAIQIISLDNHIHLEDIACPPSPAIAADILHWFADIVTFNGDTSESNEQLNCKGDLDQMSSDIEGMDYFEYMTLNLAETVDEECCFRSLEEEQSEDEESEATHLLLARPRRGQARRRQQRRDFQRDVLPGLASLSRQEVNEDMQFLGSLMKAVGQPWKAGGARRNATRSQPRGQARGRRQRRTVATDAVAEAPAVTQHERSSKGEAVKDGRSILGWGRTTKRCRSLRCPPGNILLPPPT